MKKMYLVLPLIALFCICQLSAGDLSFEHPPSNATVLEDTRYTLHCDAIWDGKCKKSNVKVKWFHNGKRIRKKAQNYRVLKKGALRFFNIRRENGGVYYCKAVCGNNSRITSENAYITIETKAKLLEKHPLDRHVQFGVSLQLKCLAEGIPTPSIQWFRGNEIINSSEHGLRIFTNLTKSNEVTSVLHINNVTSNISFKCEARNSHIQGQTVVDRSAQVVVLRKAVSGTDTELKQDRGSWDCKNSVYLLPLDLSTLMLVSLREKQKNWNYIGYIDMYEKGHKLQTKMWMIILLLSFLSLFYSSASTPVNPNQSNGPQGRCAPYNGSVCSSVLGNKVVFFNTTNSYRGTNQENHVQQLMSSILSSNTPVRSQCEGSALKIFCMSIYPECEEEDTEKEPRISLTPLCRESCSAVMELLCFEQWLIVVNNRRNSEYQLPRCEQLPSKTDNNTQCQDARVFQRKMELVSSDCYKGTGQWYNGTVNVTTGGYACQPWASQYPHKHQRLPSVFPSLENSENYCRNPGSEEDQPWCYTMDTIIRWQVCDIPRCEVPDTQPVEQKEPKFTSIAMVIVIIVTVVGLFVIILIVVLSCQICRQHKHGKYDSTPQDELDIDIDKLPTNISYHRVTDSLKMNPKLENLEYPRNDIMYIRDIGQGAFGRVFKAKAPNIIESEQETFVAVKMLKDDASEDLQQDFEREASLMSEFEHPNVVKLLGVCAIGKPMCLLFEFMNKGDLNEFLRLNSSENYIIRRHSVDIYSKHIPNINMFDQLQMAIQIANGMVYLSNNGYVHRDLATRNCLVSDGLLVKISDFGLARSVHCLNYYHGSEHDAIPIRWMPLESILYNKFSVASDVWSFGVLLWEIFSFALQPYYGMTHEEVVQFVKDGKVLACPENTPKHIYDLMKHCWSRKPTDRPVFETILKSLNLVFDEYQKKKHLSELV